MFWAIIIAILLLFSKYILYPTIQYYMPENPQPYKGKTFVMIWANGHTKEPHQNGWSKGSFWGLGDTIRGTTYMYDLSKRLGFDFYVDITQHSVSKFLTYKSDHPFQEQVYNIRDDIPYCGFYDTEVANFLKEHFQKQDVVLGMTNVTVDFTNPDVPLSKGAKNILREILQPNVQLEKMLNESLQKLPSKFTALHYRLGDNSSLVYNNTKINEKEILKHVKKYKTKDIVLFSDSKELKDLIYKKYYTDIHMFHFDIGHLGYHADETKTLHTLVEFFVMCRAKRIRTTSTYSWISNFVNAIHKVYDISMDYEVNATYLTSD
jgi:hypothetical protein